MEPEGKFWIKFNSEFRKQKILEEKQEVTQKKYSIIKEASKLIAQTY